MGYRRLTEESFRATERSVRSEGGSATLRGEQRHREGKGLDPLVDPKGYGVIRYSRNRFEEVGGKFVLTVGQAILKESRFDTTGSMGNNVEIAFKALPRSYKLLKESSGAPLGRYDLQIINSIFGDVRDNYVLCRSQAEMDEKIAEQLRLMVPEGGGFDGEEDPHYGIFGAAYLTAASIVKVGLKSYDFTTTDAPAHPEFDARTLIRVFGDDVFDKVVENGFQINRNRLPSIRDVVQDLTNRAHAFLIQVGEDGSVHSHWSKIYGRDRVVQIPTTEFLPEVEAVIVGLTEGTLNLQNVKDFLVDVADLRKEDAEMIKEAVVGIPIGAQAALPNFNKIPVAGMKFLKKEDPWPEGFDENGDRVAKAPVRKEKKKGDKVWL
jgi:hypothetical protein